MGEDRCAKEVAKEQDKHRKGRVLVGTTRDAVGLGNDEWPSTCPWRGLGQMQACWARERALTWQHRGHWQPQIHGPHGPMGVRNYGGMAKVFEE